MPAVRRGRRWNGWCRAPSPPRPGRPRRRLRAVPCPALRAQPCRPFCRARARRRRARAAPRPLRAARRSISVGRSSSSVFSTSVSMRDVLRLARQGDVEGLLALGHVDLRRMRGAVLELEVDVHRQAEHLRHALAGLRLLQRDLCRLCRVVPRVAAGEHGVAGAEHPLVEEPVEVAAGAFLDGALQVLRHDVVAAAADRVAPDRLPEQRRRPGARAAC